ncbi:MAG: MerR family transcriptional regulator [Longimicrobiales bacterium]
MTEDAGQERRWKVGELATRTGLTVRTLHHYDEVGLCSPAHRSAAGYRLYTADDVARLQRVVSLRQLGFSLDEIRDCMERPEFSLERVLDLHISRLEERIESQRVLRDRLERLANHVRSAETVSVEEFTHTIEAITMFERYYTPEQLEELKRRREALGEEGMRQAQEDWTALGAEVRAEMEKGTDPTDERVQALARRWNELVRAFTGGDAGIEASLKNRWREQRVTLAERYGGGDAYDPAVSEYIGRALAAIQDRQ